MTIVRTQLEWSKALVELKTKKFPKQVEQHSIDYFRIRYWYNPTNDRSMRLTFEGFSEFVNLDVRYYSHNLQHDILPKTLVQLEKFLAQPYFIRNDSSINTFDEATSLTLTLYNNNLQSYLDNSQNVC
jgi:hypothetical protein